MKASALSTLHDAVTTRPIRSLLASGLILAAARCLRRAENLMGVAPGTALRARAEQDDIAADTLTLAIDVMDWCLRHGQTVPGPVRDLIPAEVVRDVATKYGLDPA